MSVYECMPVRVSACEFVRIRIILFGCDTGAIWAENWPAVIKAVYRELLFECDRRLVLSPSVSAEVAAALAIDPSSGTGIVKSCLPLTCLIMKLNKCRTMKLSLLCLKFSLTVRHANSTYLTAVVNFHNLARSVVLATRKLVDIA